MKLVFSFLLSVYSLVLARSQKTKPKIIGGEEVEKGRYPYQVALMMPNLSLKPICSGVLVAEDWVLSSSACGLSGDISYVVIGRNDLLDDSESDFEEIEVLWQTIHPFAQIIGTGITNDFLMLKLAESSSFAPAVLDNGSADLPGGLNVTMIGWGGTDASGFASDKVWEAELDVVSNEDCQAWWYGVGTITESMMCAARTGKNICYGDAGGPLVIQGEKGDGSDDIVVGLMSWGQPCVENFAYPPVFAKVASEYDWITNEIENGVEPCYTTEYFFLILLLPFQVCLLYLLLV